MARRPRQCDEKRKAGMTEQLHPTETRHLPAPIMRPHVVFEAFSDNDYTRELDDSDRAGVVGTYIHLLSEELLKHISGDSKTAFNPNYYKTTSEK